MAVSFKNMMSIACEFGLNGAKLLNCDVLKKENRMFNNIISCILPGCGENQLIDKLDKMGKPTGQAVQTELTVS